MTLVHQIKGKLVACKCCVHNNSVFRYLQLFPFIGSFPLKYHVDLHISASVSIRFVSDAFCAFGSLEVSISPHAVIVNRECSSPFRSEA